MVEDGEERPMGPLIIVILLMGVVLFVIIATFDSCTDFERDEVYRYCEDMRFEVSGVLGQKYPCYDDDGFFYFSFLNTGDVDIEGVNLKFKILSVNHTDYTPRLSQSNVKVQMGLKPGTTFSRLNITPISFYENFNTTVTCDRMTQVISTIEKCEWDNIAKFN